MLRWSVHLEGGPRRVNHAAVAVGHKVYSFGGYCSGEDYETLRQIDVHVFNSVSLRWMKLPPVRAGGHERTREVPYMRYGHTAVLLDDTIYLWGGRNDTEGACNVLYAFDVNTHRWFTPKISGTVPGARDGHSACVLGKAMYIFGGYEQLADCFSNDIHRLETTTMVWSLINARGTPARWRDFHSATIIGTKMFVFGGRADRFGPFHSNNEIYCNKIKVFDTETNCWLSTPSTQLLPEGRRSHSAFCYNGELYIFGGYNARLDRHFNDLWKFNPEAFLWKKIEPKGKGPCPRRRQCCCMVGDRIVLFGGTRLHCDILLFVGYSVSTLTASCHGIGEREGIVKPFWESIHPMAMAHTVLCCPCLLTAGIEEAMNRYRTWSLTNNSSQRPSLPHVLPPFCAVKFMKSVSGTALVEMADEYAVDRAVTHLNGTKVFGKKLNVCVSRQQAVIPNHVFELADGSSSYQDFSLTRNNRFSNLHSHRNIIQPPTAVLHFYNAPPTLNQQQLLNFCSEHNAPAFTKYKVFDAKYFRLLYFIASSKTLSGLLEFDCKAAAVEALIVLNHHQFRIAGSYNPFTIKLCFSTSTHL
ncbi:hypothetical protein XENORESO_014042 [Xenotaenia resolanae]|uniref:Heterogeneous nuclear ribonucleoprotein L RRM domain-containing protein n=2 Tax=Goodeidae TaxID=28758 RepID=A0ABV0VXW8_9TELE